MKRVKTALLVPGMVIAKDVHNASNILVMGKNTILTDDSITKLAFHSIYSVYVKDEVAEVPKKPTYERTYTPSKIKEDTKKGVDETDPMAEYYKGKTQ